MVFRYIYICILRYCRFFISWPITKFCFSFLIAGIKYFISFQFNDIQSLPVKNILVTRFLNWIINWEFLCSCQLTMPGPLSSIFFRSLSLIKLLNRRVNRFITSRLSEKELSCDVFFALISSNSYSICIFLYSFIKNNINKKQWKVIGTFPAIVKRIEMVFDWCPMAIV